MLSHNQIFYSTWAIEFWRLFFYVLDKQILCDFLLLLTSLTSCLTEKKGKKNRKNQFHILNKSQWNIQLD